MSSVPTGRPRIPADLWPNIIQSLSPPPSSTRIPYVPGSEESLRIRGLMACATVCRSWRKLAQIELHAVVWVPGGPALWKFIRTITLRPDLLRPGTRLVAAPKTWKSLESPIADYVPIIPFLSLCSTYIEHIQLANFSWDPQLYGWQYGQGLRSQSVTRVELVGFMTPSLADILPFLTSFANLTHLTLVGVYLETQPTEQEVIQLQALPSNRFSESLRSIEVGGEGLGIGWGVQLFGNEIELFHLYLSIGDTPIPSIHHHHRCLAQYPDMTCLSLTLEPWISLKSPQAGDPDEAERVWSSIHRTFLGILCTVGSHKVRELDLAIVPQQQEPPDAASDSSTETDQTEPWNVPNRYRHTREGMMDALFTDDVRSEILLSPAFASLAVIKLLIHESAGGRNREWWAKQVARRLQFDTAKVRVKVRDFPDPFYDDMWNKSSQEDSQND